MTGIIIPVGWCENGCVKTLGILTSGEEFYILKHSEGNQKLEPLIGKEVELTGHIYQNVFHSYSFRSIGLHENSMVDAFREFTKNIRRTKHEKRQ
jgi:hypothetical protein